MSEELIKIRAKSGRINGYEKNMLLKGRCKSHLPVNYLKESNGEYLVYNSESYQRLSEHKFWDQDELMEVLIHIMKKLIDAEDYLLFHEKHLLEVDGIYWNPITKSVKLVYGNDSGEAGLCERICNLLSDLEQTLDIVGFAPISQQIKEKISSSNLGLKEILSYLESVRRDWYNIDPILF